MSKKLMSEFNMKGVEKKHQKKKMKFSSTLTYSLVMGKSMTATTCTTDWLYNIFEV